MPNKPQSLLEIHEAIIKLAGEITGMQEWCYDGYLDAVIEAKNIAAKIEDLAVKAYDAAQELETEVNEARIAQS